MNDFGLEVKDNGNNFNFISPEALTECCLKVPNVCVASIYARIAAFDLRVYTSKFSDGKHKGLVITHLRYLARNFTAMEFDAARDDKSGTVGIGVSFRTPIGDVIENVYGQLNLSHVGGLSTVSPLGGALFGLNGNRGSDTSHGNSPFGGGILIPNL